MFTQFHLFFCVTLNMLTNHMHYLQKRHFPVYNCSIHIETVNALRSYSTFLALLSHRALRGPFIYLFIHTQIFMHHWAAAAMQGAARPIKSN